MKKVMAILLATCFVEWQTDGCAGAPIVGFVPPGPGINAPLDNDGEGVDYGWKSLQTGNWSYNGDAASIDNNNGVLRYRTSNQGNTTIGPVAAMSPLQDWVFEISYKHTGAFGGEWPWFVKAEENAADARIVHLRQIGGANDTWSLAAGISGGGWSPIGDPFSLGSDFNKFTVHYKAGTSTIDAYRNDVLIPGASDFTLGHGNYSPDFVQLEWMRQGTDSYRSLKLGQVVPEPSSLLMIGLVGAIALAVRLVRNK